MRRRKMRDSYRFAFWRWQDILTPHEVLTDINLHGLTYERQVYLRKLYLVRTPWRQATLHWIRRSDPGRDLHDHPRDFTSIILRGGYVEERPSGTAPLWSEAPDGSQAGPNTVATLHIAPKIVRRRAEDLHRIAAVMPHTLTLVLWGPRRRAWGFETAKGWIPWRTYVGAGQEELPQ